MEEKEIFTEVYIIIQNMEESIRNKIPKEIQEEIRKNINLNSIKLVQKLDVLEISDEAKGYISVLYTEYICNSEEKEKWDKIDNLIQGKIE